MAHEIDVDYKPAGDTLRRFHLSDAFMRILFGPLGSAKTTACCMELWRRMIEQAPDDKNNRQSRWLAVRNSYPELETTTIPEWRGIFGDDFGRFTHGHPPTHTISVGLPDQTRVEAELIFMALDDPDGPEKLRGMALTGIWFNEMREIPRSVVTMGLGRCGRFPHKRDGGPTWFGAIADTNSFDEDHWLYEIAEVAMPDGWAVFRQPGGVVKENGRYVPNPQAENFQNLPPNYYQNQLAGADIDWAKVYLANEYGFVMDGKAVFPEYTDSLHCQEVDPDPNLPLVCGLDFGLSPAALYAQQLPTGRVLWVDELVSDNMGAVRLSELLHQRVAERYSSFDISFIGDPAGDSRAQTDEKTVFDILKANDIPARPAPTNDFTMRREAVARPMSRLIDGNAGFAVHPRCRKARKALMGGYNYRRIQIPGTERYADKPDKNEYSHVADAGQYANLGLGEGQAVLNRKRKQNQRRQRVAHSDYDWST